MPKRRADGLAGGAREPERPHGQMPALRPHAGHVGNDGRHLVQRGHFMAGQDVGAIGRRRVFAAESKALDEIVDVGEMVVDFPAAQHRKAAHGVPEQLQESAVARTVDAARPDNRDLDAEPRRGRPRPLFPFDFRPLIDVARPERRVLVRRRMLDVAVHAHRTAVHDATHAGARRLLDEVSDRDGVDGSIRLVRQTGLSIERGDVVDDLDALHRPADRRRRRADRRTRMLDGAGQRSEFRSDRRADAGVPCDRAPARAPGGPRAASVRAR